MAMLNNQRAMMINHQIWWYPIFTQIHIVLRTLVTQHMLNRLGRREPVLQKCSGKVPRTAERSQVQLNGFLI